jgi:hypothetical protein
MNLIMMDIYRHEAYHFLFHDRTFEESAALLVRAAKLKARIPHHQPA